MCVFGAEIEEKEEEKDDDDDDSDDDNETNRKFGDIFHHSSEGEGDGEGWHTWHGREIGGWVWWCWWQNRTAYFVCFFHASFYIVFILIFV